MHLSSSFVALLQVMFLAQYASASTSLPVVDLGYELHQASSFNITGGYYNFSNIRFAAPPLGDLRFRVPQPPATNRSAVQDGAIDRICPQAYPKWINSLEPQFIASYLSGQSFNGSTNLSDYRYYPFIQDPRVTEDCLFLDMLVPQTIFEKARRGKYSSGAPVLVWIYGGGYTFGSKSSQSGAQGLLQRSQADGSDGIIYVSFNYRLGAFGWSSGPTFEKSGTSNAGLLDQRMALEWVREHIHKFGGDPTRVTVFGESAGGGSIMHQITAFGGRRGRVPFQRALLQSPGFLPLPSRIRQDQNLQQYLELLNVSTIDEARKLPSDVLINASARQVGEFSDYGDFLYGPAVDGTLVPDLPGKLLLSGQFDHSPEVMVGSNSDEGLLFTSPQQNLNTGYSIYLDESFPDITVKAAEYISNILYPPIYNGPLYKDRIGRGALTNSDLCFQCNTVYLNHAFRGRTYAYRFSIPPGLHASDLPYTFYSGPNSSVQNETIALILQDYVTSFAKTGAPKSTLGPRFGFYGPDSKVMYLGLDKVAEIIDPAANRRCEWWQHAFYYNQGT